MNREQSKDTSKRETTGAPLRETEIELEGHGGIDDGLLEPKNESGPRKGPDVNAYQQKKTLAQGMMDLALLSANANQLRYTLEMGWNQKYYLFNVVMISTSIVLQCIVGLGLIWNARYNIKKDAQMEVANKINNITTIGVFIITVLNVFISAFGIPGVNEVSPLTTGVVVVGPK